MRYRTAVHLARVLLAVGLLSGCQGNDSIDVVGTLEWDRIELTADAAEPIVAIEVREGDAVDAGQMLLQLDARRVQARLDESRALLAQHVARLAELQRGPRMERITQARATLAGAEGTLEAALHELNRVRPLVKQELLTRQDLDTARAAYDMALAKKRGQYPFSTFPSIPGTGGSAGQAGRWRDCRIAGYRGQSGYPPSAPEPIIWIGFPSLQTGRVNPYFIKT